MACTQERAQEIGELAGGRLSAVRAEALLEHVAGCAACSSELDLVADLLQAPALAPARRRRLRGRRALVALALAAGLVALLVPWRGREPGARGQRLARLEPPAATALVLRAEAPEGLDPALDRALERIGARDWQAAEEALVERLDARPEDPLALFYLGLARIQLGRLAAALPVLEEAGRLGSGLLAEQALWYRAQALLALERTAEARSQLEELVRLEGDFEPNAREQLAELARR